jgi:hypothetical protein
MNCENEGHPMMARGMYVDGKDDMRIGRMRMTSDEDEDEYDDERAG